MAVFLTVLLFLFPPSVSAFYDPLSVPNNAYGMHVADVNDITEVAKLVNSSGGDWGYITIVIEEYEKNREKWQGVFDTLRRLHLIPLIRLATTPKDGVWNVPSEQTIPQWVDFLDSLNWPTENRYIILFNEPNHAKEWGGNVMPEEYARIALAFSRALKLASEDFFILPAGLDVSASTSKESLDAAVYLRRMVNAEPDLRSVFDGWTSHAYPNPDFQGSPYARGRGTVGSYLWEQAYAESLGFTKALPVFITETGWAHSEGKNRELSRVSPDIVAAHIRDIASSLWQDPRIAAVTPFIFNYQDIPFDHFSFRKFNSNEYYPHYSAYYEIPKKLGMPKQRHEYSLEGQIIPNVLVTGSYYTLQQLIVNTGQGILSGEEFSIVLESDAKFELRNSVIPHVEPKGSGTLTIYMKTPDTPGQYRVKLALIHPQFESVLSESLLTLVPPPSLHVSLIIPPRTPHELPGVRVVLQQGNTVVHDFQNLSVFAGNVSVPNLMNIVPGQQYKISVMIPGYLTREQNALLTSGVTLVSFGKFYPFDANGNGRFDAYDALRLTRHTPFSVIRLLLH